MPQKKLKGKSPTPHSLHAHEDDIVAQKLARLAAFTELNPRPVIEIDFKGNVLDINSSANYFFPELKKQGAKHPYLANLGEVVAFLKKEKRPFRRYVKVKEKLFKQLFYYIPDFQLIHVYGSDNTEKHKAKERLQEREKRYRMLFEKMNYGYAVQDIIFDEHKKPADYRFVDINTAFERLLKLKREDIVGKTVNELFNNVGNREKNSELYDDVAVSGKPAHFEHYNERLRKYFEFYVYRPVDNQLAIVFSDITNRKKTDEEKNNFIAIMSHELRNPLTPIMANAQFIRTMLQHQPAIDPAIKESVEIIEKESKMMADILNDILDVSKLSRNKIKLEKKKINISDVVKNSVKASMPFINTKRQKISVVFDQNPIYIHADPVRMEQIMVNIINNASKYTQPKGYIQIHGAIKDDIVQVRIKDNGTGMDQAKIQRIFELFNDEGQPFMGIGGLGIGLNIVKNLVTMHKGTILVHSDGNNQGSEFTLTFPLDKSQLDNKTTPVKKVTPEYKKNTSRVLIVDDNEDIRDAMSKILHLAGHTIKTTYNGAQAIAIAKTFKPHTALIDIGLPDMSGYKVAKILKDQPQHKKVKLIALTGYGQEKDKNLAKEAGFDYHITKPVDIDHLITLI
jgi:PAS domain S-box-containing protein